MEYGIIPGQVGRQVIPTKRFMFNLLLASDASAGDVGCVPLDLGLTGEYVSLKQAVAAGYKSWPCAIIQDGGTKLTDVSCTVQGEVFANVVSAAAAASGAPVYLLSGADHLTTAAGGKMVGNLLAAHTGAAAVILTKILFDGGVVGAGV